MEVGWWLGRIPHDLRRSGVKHYIEAGVDPHIVMAWGHRTRSMLDRYHIIDLADLRRAGKQASCYRGPKRTSAAPRSGRERAHHPHTQSRREQHRGAVVELRGR
jgi:hypothetical protein